MFSNNNKFYRILSVVDSVLIHQKEKKNHQDSYPNAFLLIVFISHFPQIDSFWFFISPSHHSVIFWLLCTARGSQLIMIHMPSSSSSSSSRLFGSSMCDRTKQQITKVLARDSRCEIDFGSAAAAAATRGEEGVSEEEQAAAAVILKEEIMYCSRGRKERKRKKTPWAATVALHCIALNPLRNVWQWGRNADEFSLFGTFGYF